MVDAHDMLGSYKQAGQRPPWGGGNFLWTWKVWTSSIDMRWCWSEGSSQTQAIAEAKVLWVGRSMEWWETDLGWMNTEHGRQSWAMRTWWWLKYSSGNSNIRKRRLVWLREPVRCRWHYLCHGVKNWPLCCGIINLVACSGRSDGKRLATVRTEGLLQALLLMVLMCT